VLTVPLLRDGAAIGAINLRRTEVRPFTRREAKLVETFAEQATLAIENVRLFNETKESLDRQTATADVLKTISRSALDLGPVHETRGADPRRLSDGAVRPDAPRRRGHRRHHGGPQRGQAIQPPGDRSCRDVREPSCDRDRERPSLQRDAGGIETADRDRRGAQD